MRQDGVVGGCCCLRLFCLLGGDIAAAANGGISYTPNEALLEEFEDGDIGGAAAAFGAPVAVDLGGGGCGEIADEFEDGDFGGVAELSFSAHGAEVFTGEIEAECVETFAGGGGITNGADGCADALQRLIDRSDRVGVFLTFRLEVFNFFGKVDQLHIHHLLMIQRFCLPRTGLGLTKPAGCKRQILYSKHTIRQYDFPLGRKYKKCEVTAGNITCWVEKVDQMRSFASTFLLIIFTFSCWGEDWPQFQQNSQRQGRAETGPKGPYRARWIWLGPDFTLRNKAANPQWKDDLTGRDGYSYPMPKAVPMTLAEGMQPIHKDGVVYVLDQEGPAYAIAMHDGTTKWIGKNPGGSTNTAVIAGKLLICASITGRVTALKLADGTEAWAVETGRDTGRSAGGG